MTPIYTRIQKLLALANNTAATEAEAALAAEHVQRLLQEHNLTLSQVEAEGGSGDGGTREKVTTNDYARYPWQRDLMAALAENSFVLHQVARIRTTKGTGGEELGYTRISRKHMLVGRQINVDTVRRMYEYLCRAVERAAEEAGCGDRSDRMLFREGAVSRLTERLAERRREAEEAQHKPATGNGTHRELVLTDVYGTEADLNNDALNNYPAGTTAVNRQRAHAKETARQAEEVRLVAEGVEPTEAFYRAHGYGEEIAKTYAERWNKRSRRGGGRGRSQGWARSDAEYRKVNSPSYKAGRAAGGSIGLDGQVGASSTKRLGRS